MSGWNTIRGQNGTATPAPLYDHAQEAEWRHLDTCDCLTYVHARLPRVNCSSHGVRQVKAGWASSGLPITDLFESRVIDTLKECDVTGTTHLTRTSWDQAWLIMEKAVARGQARKQRRVPVRMNIDEKAFAKRHRYETLVCDCEQGTVEYVADDRRQESLEQYYRQFTADELRSIEAIAMDMHEPYIAATKTYVPDAASKIVFDKECGAPHSLSYGESFVMCRGSDVRHERRAPAMWPPHNDPL